MIFQYSPFFFPLFLAAGITAALAYFGWRNQENPVAAPFTLLMVSATVWTAGYAVQLCCADLSLNQLMNTIEYIGIVIIPLAWLLLVLRYTGRAHYITLRNVVLLSVVPALVVLLVATNQYHHLFYSAEYPEQIAGSVVWVFLRGPLFWLHAAYSYLLLLIALVLLASRYSGSPAVYRRQIALLVVASSIPVIVNIFYVAALDPVPGLDLTPITFTIVGAIIATGLFRFQLFLTLPVAYPQVFFAVSDGIIVADTSNRILDLNPAARQIAEEKGEFIGMSLSECFPQLSRFVASDGCATESHQEIMIPQDGNSRWYDVVCRQLRVSGQSPTGHIFILRDITDRHLALEALASAHKKLNLLSTVTRHDMMNKITGLMVYLDLLRSTCDPAMHEMYLQRIDDIARMIRDEITFTRDYQEMGVKSPTWQDLSFCIANAKSQVDMGGISVTGECAGVELYADPLLVKVFINLLENAVRHGGSRMNGVHFSCRPRGDALIVTCEDDGAGIEEADKARLFTRGFGKHTGLGLFLSREIIRSTGLTIEENGTPACGARFEITVPAGSFRYTGKI